MRGWFLGMVCIAFAVTGVSWGGFALHGRTGSSPGRTVDLGSATVILPNGFEYVQQLGVDTLTGKFVSGDRKTVIHYDVGPFAGIYAKPEGRLDSMKVLSFQADIDDGIPYRTLVAMRNVGPGRTVTTVYVSYPDAGPANFWCDVASEGDSARAVAAVLQLQLRKKRP